MEDKLRYAKPAFIDLFVLLNMSSIGFSEHGNSSIAVPAVMELLPYPEAFS